MKKMAVVWYKQAPERRWDEVVEALICHEDIQAAVKLAIKSGVDWKPLLTKAKKYKQ